MAIALGERLEGFDEERFRREVADLVGYFVDAAAGSVQAGRIVLEVARIATNSALRPPQELVLLGRALSNLDAVGAALAPGFDVRDALTRHAHAVMTRRMLGSLSPHSMMRRALEAKELVEEAPRRLNALLGNLAENRFQVGFEAADAAVWRTTIHRAASRLTLGVILASLIVGAALLARVDAGPEIFGYPALSALFFVVAGLGGVALATQIVWESWRGAKEDRR